MAEYRIKSSGEVKTQGEIRKLNPNTSLPKVWGANACDALGIDPVLASPKPEASGEFKTVVRNGVEQDANGNWVYAWIERDMFSDYTDEDGTVHTKAEQEAAYATEQAQQRMDAIEAAVVAHLDTVVKERRYDNIVSACSYAGYDNPYQAEGQAAVAWRGAVWAYAAEEFAKLALGTRTEPTAEEFIAELPTISWPA